MELPNNKKSTVNLIQFQGHSKKVAKKAAAQAAVEALYGDEFVLEEVAVPATFNTNLWKPS